MSFICCFGQMKRKPVWVAPIVMSKPVPFTAPPNPGFKLAPHPPEGKGPSIIFEKDFDKDHMPVGLHLSDLSGSFHSEVVKNS